MPTRTPVTPRLSVADPEHEIPRRLPDSPVTDVSGAVVSAGAVVVVVVGGTVVVVVGGTVVVVAGGAVVGVGAPATAPNSAGACPAGAPPLRTHGAGSEAT